MQIEIDTDVPMCRYLVTGCRYVQVLLAKYLHIVLIGNEKHSCKYLREDLIPTHRYRVGICRYYLIDTYKYDSRYRVTVGSTIPANTYIQDHL